MVGLTDVNFIIRECVQRSVWMSACLPFVCDHEDLFTDNLHHNAPVDFKKVQHE